MIDSFCLGVDIRLRNIEIMVSTFSFSFYNFNSIIFIIMLHDIYNNCLDFIQKKLSSKVDLQTIMVL